MKKFDQKLVPYQFLILVKIPKQLTYARNSFENRIFWKKFIKRSSFALVPFYG